MTSFDFSLDPEYQIPVFTLVYWHNIRALLDTGAYTPMWTYTESSLRKIGGRPTYKTAPASGVAGSVECHQYVIPSVRIGPLAYKDLKVLYTDKFQREGFHLLLSATMFDGLIYEINRKKHILTLSIPEDESLDRVVRIRDSNGEYHNLCESLRYLGDGG